MSFFGFFGAVTIIGPIVGKGAIREFIAVIFWLTIGGIVARFPFSERKKRSAERLGHFGRTFCAASTNALNGSGPFPSFAGETFGSGRCAGGSVRVKVWMKRPAH